MTIQQSYQQRGTSNIMEDEAPQVHRNIVVYPQGQQKQRLSYLLLSSGSYSLSNIISKYRTGLAHKHGKRPRTPDKSTQ